MLKTNDDRMLEGVHGDDVGAILAPVAEDLRRAKKSLSKIPESGIAPPANLDTAPVFVDSIRITRRVQDMVVKEGGALDILDAQMAMDDGDEVTGAMKLKQKLALALVTKTLPTQKLDMNPDGGGKVRTLAEIRKERVGRDGSVTTEVTRTAKIQDK